ncbi:leukocyte elastase inhibitor-like isoform X1 [Maylandia zebra]|uniref:leukocyte elastase inhibitor-like isoform X1 n=1 Tax=Maylandia zebra TaxID=106582 RepID=UPI00403C1F9C
MDDSGIKKQNWDVKETELFLEILKELDMKKCLDGRKVRNNKLFKVAHRRMTAAGYHRSVDQLKFRWKLLKSAYYKCKREPDSPAPTKIQGWWRYEKTMVAIMESRHPLVGPGVNSDRNDEVTEESDGEASVLHWPQPCPDNTTQNLDLIIKMDPEMDSQLKIGFIGAGNMAFGIAKGILSGNVLPANVKVSAPSSRNLGRFQALSFSSGEGVHADCQKLNADINSPSASYILKLANRLYGENTAHFLPDFLEATQKYYQADLKTVDFIGAPEACRAEINSWVEQQTENKIKDLLKPGTVNADTRLALVNAVYFKGNWKNPFKEPNTKEMPFKIKQLEKELTQERLNEWTDRKNMEVDLEVLVDLPKFKLEEDYELNEPLTKLGMKDVFCAGSADLSGMNGEGGLFLSTVAHKVFVEVNEEGTQAAAATGVVSRNLSSGWTRYFTADHPFLFFIRHNETKSVLFFGRFSSPQ